MSTLPPLSPFLTNRSLFLSLSRLAQRPRMANRSRRDVVHCCSKVRGSHRPERNVVSHPGLAWRAYHLSEEVRDASWVLPRSMAVAAAINYTVGFVMTMTVMMIVGEDSSTLLDSQTGQIYVQILLNITHSRVGSSIPTALMAVLLLFSVVNCVCSHPTSSRSPQSLLEGSQGDGGAHCPGRVSI